MTIDSKSKKIRDELNAVSPSFCLAKWQQVTMHLQLGQTHSCHHPPPHKIPIEEIETDPSALHNTLHKKNQRKKMLEGERPSECSYCWNIEDAHVDNISDRTYKSAESWAYPELKRIASSPWDKNVNPSYLEVSFGYECNFRCAYCDPRISSSIMNEVKKFGPYKVAPYFGVDNLKKTNQMPIPKDEPNPYLEAFWKWWPTMHGDLEVFRITGGEPLLNPNTFKFLDYIKESHTPNLKIAVNSNLGIPDMQFNKFINDVNFITKNNLVKSFELYTSVDTYGKNAEFIRFGLNYDNYMKNVERFLQETEEVQLVFMSTYNAFSVINFRRFLEKVTELKIKYKNKNNYPRVILDTPYLKDPNYLSCYVLTEDFWKYPKQDLEYLNQVANSTKDGIPLYSEYEISKFERIVHWLESLTENEHRNNVRRSLSLFIKEYEERKEVKFDDYCPEYLHFKNYCDELLNKR